MPMVRIPRRRSTPESMASSAHRNGPCSARSPAMTSTVSTAASPLSRAKKSSKLPGIGEIAHRHVRHRLKAGRAHADRGGERFLGRPVRHRAEIDARAALEHRERGDVGVGRPRRLDGKSGHQCRDARDRIGGGVIWNWECGHHALTIPRLSSRSRRRRGFMRAGVRSHRIHRRTTTRRVRAAPRAWRRCSARPRPRSPSRSSSTCAT